MFPKQRSRRRPTGGGTRSPRPRGSLRGRSSRPARDLIQKKYLLEICLSIEHQSVTRSSMKCQCQRAGLLGFWVRFAGQNPSLGTLRVLGFGLFGLFQAFLVRVQHEICLCISSCVSCMLFQIGSSESYLIIPPILSTVY